MTTTATARPTRPTQRATLAVTMVLVALVTFGALAAPATAAPDAPGTWVPTTSPMTQARENHTATVLYGDDCNTASPPAWCGKVLVAGGRGSTNQSLRSSELYDPRAGMWTATSTVTATGEVTTTMGVARAGHTAVLLPGAKAKVLVLGGEGDISALETKAEIYDAEAGTWTTAASSPVAMNTGSVLASVLAGPRCTAQCGKVLVVGVNRPASFDPDTSVAFLYDPPPADRWVPINPPINPRDRRPAILLEGTASQCGDNCGKVLVIGGTIFPDTAEFFDPLNMLWTPTPALVDRSSGDAVLQRNGTVLRNSATSSARYLPKSNEWVPAGTTLANRQSNSFLTALPDGRALAVENRSGSSANFPAEIYYPAATGFSGEWRPLGFPVGGGNYRQGNTLLGCDAVGGRVLVSGGYDDFAGGPLSSAYLFTGVPTLRNAAPGRSSVAGGQVVKLDGLGFNGSTKVFFGSDEAQNVMVNDDRTKVTATAPPATAPVDVDVRVEVDGRPADTCGKTFPFRYVPANCPVSGQVAAGPSGGTWPHVGGSGGAASAGAAGFGLFDGGLTLSAWAAAAVRRRRRKQPGRPGMAPICPPRRRRGGEERGFTLVELLVVVVILGILSAVVVFAAGGSGDKGEKAAAQTDERTIRTAMEVFCSQENRYPGPVNPMGELVPKYLSNPSEYHILQTGTADDDFPTAPPNTQPIEGNCPGSPAGPQRYKLIPTRPVTNQPCP